MDGSIAKSKRWRVSTLAATIAVLVAACGNPAPSTSTAKNGGTLIWALDSDVDTLNPFVMSTVPDYRVLSFLLPNLYSADKNLNIIPDLADGMPSVSSDSLVWTVKLKKNAKWSDGTAITADDVLATQKIQADPKLDTDYSYDWSKLSSIEKVDANTVKYTLSEKFAPFLVQNLVGYVGLVTMINLALGAVTTVMLYLIGFPNPITFGLLTTGLNYVPYIGPGIVATVLFAVGLVAMPSLAQAALAPALFVAIATLEGHFITPSIVGRRLTLSPFLVFLALVFWTWLWGPIGAFLAVPLLIVSIVILGHLWPQEEMNLPG